MQANYQKNGAKKTSFKEKLNASSNIKKVIAVMSGKGGVGKSFTTSMLAVAASKLGYKVGILDADITGPSIPMSFGIDTKADANQYGFVPAKTESGIKIMSINLVLPNVTDPVVWRGPIVGNVVKQFWTDVVWGELDFLFIDMPPGTGDVPLTVFQSLTVDEIIVVTSPQELVSMIVAKAVNMADAMNIKITGVIENMSYFVCPDNEKIYHIFGESRIKEAVKLNSLELLAQLPIDSNIPRLCDKGMIENIDETTLSIFKNIINKV